jgi:hypothetical protein
MELIDTILDKMSNIFKPQHKFISVLLTTVMLMHGKVNFRNMSRYSSLCEKTFSRQFRNPFDFARFNMIGTEMSVTPQTLMIAAIDCSFIAKSGRHTYGLGKFYNGARSEAEKGLEISELAVVDVNYNTAYSVSAWQTPDSFSAGHTRTDWYVEHFVQDAPCLPPSIRYLAADGYYAKKKFTDGVTAAGYHLISKLRHDADLRYLYAGEQKPKGRPKMYDGKVRFDNTDRFEFVHGTDDNVSLYTAVVNSPSLKRNIRVVYLVRRLNGKVATALLFSTDIHLSATDIYRFYKARFQIEFLFRDAKQFAGLSDCQARCEISLDFHFNACMTALNLMKWESRRIMQSEFNPGCSVASVKIRNFNEYLLKRFCNMSGLDFSSIKSADAYNEIINIGAIAA